MPTATHKLNGEGSGSWSGNLGNTATTREFSTSTNASFDLDFFGRLKNMGEARAPKLLAAEEAQRAVRISAFWFLMSRKAISISNWRMRNCK